MIDDDVIESTLLSVEALGGDEVMIGDTEVSAVTATVLLPSCCVGQRRLRAVTAELPAARPGLSLTYCSSVAVVAFTFSAIVASAGRRHRDQLASSPKLEAL